MEPSCGWICNPTIVWLDEFAVVKILDRMKKPTGCPRFDPAFGSNNNPLSGSLSIMIITEHSIFVGWRLLCQNPAVYEPDVLVSLVFILQSWCRCHV